MTFPFFVPKTYLNFRPETSSSPACGYFFQPISNENCRRNTFHLSNCTKNCEKSWRRDQHLISSEGGNDTSSGQFWGNSFGVFSRLHPQTPNVTILSQNNDVGHQNTALISTRHQNGKCNGGDWAPVPNRDECPPQMEVRPHLLKIVFMFINYCAENPLSLRACTFQ